MTRKSLIVFVVAVAILVATGAVIRAQGQAQVRACADCPPPQAIGNLPPVKGPMNRDSVGEALSVLSFDDGSCESGLGAGVAATSIVEFDVPTQCVMGGLDVVGLTTRVGTGSGNSFAFAQAGATPPGFGALSTVPVAPIGPSGACPATALVTRAIGPGAAIITGTANFFGGVVNNGFVGRDTNGPPAGRIWFNCSTCGMTQYTPTTLSGIGLGGNWMIRVTVEDASCIPVELMGFDVS